MRFRQIRLSNSSTRSAIALLALIAICCGSVPIPLGILYRDAKDLSQPFPCQHCGCGCKNAEQCWISCCCFTPSEKLAWAKRNGVTPPAYAAKDSGAFGETTSSCASNAQPGCSKCIAASTAGKFEAVACSKSDKKCDNVKEARPACCAAKALLGCTNAATIEAEDAKPESQLVLSIMALKCKGAANLFTNLPWAIVDQVDSNDWLAEPLGRFSLPQSVEPLWVYLSPDDPPPRCVS